MNTFYGNLKIKRLSIEISKFDYMYILSFIPYLTWTLIGLMILFYGFVFQSKRYRLLVALHMIIFVLLCGQSLYFDAIDVSNIKGHYTPAIIDLLFVIIFLFLSVFLFREKIKVYKKIIIAVTLAFILLVSVYEYFILTIGGFKDPTEKTYVINNRFTLRKIFLDFGRPYPYRISESKYIIFERSWYPMYQIGADDFDSLKVIKSTVSVLKLRIYRKEKISDATILLKYDQNEKPSCGLIKVEKNHKSGYLDLHLKVVIPLEYNYLQGFDGNGICIAHKNGKVGAINTKNQIVKPFK